MASRKRSKRPTLERDGPLRGRVLGPIPGAAPRRNGNGVAGAVEGGLEAGRELARAADQTMRGAVEAGVETAYVVYEEYMARGRDAALRYRERSAGMSESNRGGSYGDAWSQAWGPMAPMMAPWNQMMRMWADGMSMFVPGWNAMASQWMPGAAGAWGAAPSVSVLVSSKNPAEVRADIRPGAQSRKLSVAALEPHGSTEGPSFAGVTIEAHGEGLRVSVTVPKDQPAGSYYGTVVDEAGGTQGHVFVELQGGTGTGKRKK